MNRDLPISIELPEEFYNEETRCGYTITSDIKELWAVELDLLKKLDDVCKKLKIKYFLDSGNLLGAVRDGHFIPWDDDIDIVMLREDYDKLINSGESFETPYFLQTSYSDIEYTRPHAQLRNSKTCAAMRSEANTVRFNQGVFLDIFPLDGIDDIDPKGQLETIKDMISPADYIAFHHSKNFISETLRYVRACIYRIRYGDIKYIFARMEDYLRTFKEKEYVDKISFRKNMSEIRYLKKKWFEDGIEVNFEGFNCNIPSNYHEVLKAYYGKDYLIPQQVSTMHGMNGGMIYDVHKSYSKILAESRIVE